MGQTDVAAAAADFQTRFHTVTSEIRRTIVGYGDVIDDVVAALVVGGNVLVEGVPGLGKTMLLLTLARTCNLTFRRVQFTPDLMPADITGTQMISQQDGRRTIEFVRGPIFTNLLLADEINRATPRTQSALLEAMEEHSVTAGGQTMRLDEPFFVMATQNPIEQEGTYPLPEPALDKFLFKLIVAMPDAAELREIIERTTAAAMPDVRAVAARDDILAMRRTVLQVPVAPHVEDFALRLIEATRSPHRYIRSGPSPRGLRALLLGSRVRALLRERYNVSIEDICAMALPALRHRLTLSFEAESENVTPDSVITEILAGLDTK